MLNYIFSTFIFNLFQVVGALGVQEATRPHTKGESEAEGAERPGESGATAGEIHTQYNNIQVSEIFTLIHGN